MAGIVIGIVVFLLLRFAGQLIQLLFLLGVVLLQVFLLLVIDGPSARTRYTLPVGLALVCIVLWQLCVVRAT